MVTRAEAYAATVKAWSGEPCPKHGRPMGVCAWDDEGVVWSWCAACEREYWTAFEPWPVQLADDPETGDDLPF